MESLIRKAFRNIQEKYIKNSSAMKEWDMASRGFLPLTPSIMKEFQKPFDLAYHATDEDGLRTLVKLQHKKKEISTFRKGSKGIADGARRETQFIVELKGVSSFWAETDIYSQLSRNGYKWLDPLMTEKNYVVNNKFSVPMFEKMIKYFKVKDRFEVKKKVQELDGKEKQKFIKWYFDESKKLINQKLLNEIKDSIAKSYAGEFNNDEVFLHNFEILGVWVVIRQKLYKNRVADYQDFSTPSKEEELRAEEVRKMGLEFLGFIEQREVEYLNAEYDINNK